MNWRRLISARQYNFVYTFVYYSLLPRHAAKQLMEYAEHTAIVCLLFTFTIQFEIVK